MDQNVCRNNKFSYCKYGENCRFLHINEECDDNNCDISACKKRHPKICRYFRDFRKCKYLDYCRYKHGMNVNNITIKQIETKCKELKNLLLKRKKNLKR